MESGDDEDQFAVLSDLEPLSSSCDESDGNESEVGSIAWQFSGPNV